MTYTFSVNNRSYRREVSMSKGEYTKGDWVTITYVIEDPATSHLGLPGFDSGTLLFIVLIPGFFISYGLLLFFKDLPRRRRVARLRRNGQLIFGQLMSSRGKEVQRGWGKSRHTDYDVTIFYQFVNPDQKRIDSNETFIRNDLKNKYLPPHGAVAVLYASDDDFMVL